MSRLRVDLPDRVADELRRQAEERDLSVSEYIRQVLEERAEDQWPPGFFDRVAGSWKGEPLSRPAQGEPEERDRL